MQGRGLPWLCQARVFPGYPIQGPLCRGRRLLWLPKAIFRLSKAMSSTAVRVFFACPGLCLLRLSVFSLHVQGYVFYGCPCLLCMSRAMSSTAVRVFFACPRLCLLRLSVSSLHVQGYVFYGCPCHLCMSRAMSSTAVGVFFACPGLCLLRLSVSSLHVQGYVFYGCPCLLCMSRAMSSTAVRVFFACPGLCFYWLLWLSKAVPSCRLWLPKAVSSLAVPAVYLWLSGWCLLIFFTYPRQYFLVFFGWLRPFLRVFWRSRSQSLFRCCQSQIPSVLTRRRDEGQFPRVGCLHAQGNTCTTPQGLHTGKDTKTAVVRESTAESGHISATTERWTVAISCSIGHWSSKDRDRLVTIGNRVSRGP